MDHRYAAEHHLVEQYLLNELSPEAHDQFEEHYFDCLECAAELRSTAAFFDSARSEFLNPAPEPAASPRENVRAPRTVRTWLEWRPLLAFGALATALLVIGYQNAVVVPGLRQQVASLQTPEILPTISLVRANSRGAAPLAAAVGGARAVLLQLDIPWQERFSHYTCELFSPDSALLWTADVSAQQAKDMLSVRVPLAKSPAGNYSLLVKGNRPGPSAEPAVDLATYRFSVDAGQLGSGQ